MEWYEDPAATSVLESYFEEFSDADIIDEGLHRTGGNYPGVTWVRDGGKKANSIYYRGGRIYHKKSDGEHFNPMSGFGDGTHVGTLAAGAAVTGYGLKKIHDRVKEKNAAEAEAAERERKAKLAAAKKIDKVPTHVKGNAAQPGMYNEYERNRMVGDRRQIKAAMQ
jgi:hypothetical protein